MEDSMTSEIDGIGHRVLESRFGYLYMRIKCPKCGIWFDGPVLLEEGGVHFFPTYRPKYSHEIVRIAAEWQKRLKCEAEIPIEYLHIHVQMVDLNFYPDWIRCGQIEYYRRGKPLTELRDLVEGNFDVVLISLFPKEADEEQHLLKEFEEIILHELVHAAFPRAGGSRKVPVTASIEEFFRDEASERWVYMKREELLKKYGYVYPSLKGGCRVGGTQEW